MSNRLVKNGSSLELVGDEVIARITITKSGQVKVEAPMVPPVTLCKILSNLIHDLTFASFQPAEIPIIQPPTM